MRPARKALHIPPRLRAALLGGVASLACSSTASPPGGGSGSAFDGGPCKIHVPPGQVCETACVNVFGVDAAPYACQVSCTLPHGGPGTCSCNGGVVPESGVCPGFISCELDALSDGGTQVLC